MKAILLSLTTELVPVCLQLWFCVSAGECCVTDKYSIYVPAMVRESVQDRQTSVSPVPYSTYLNPYLRNVSLTNLSFVIQCIYK